MWDFIFGQNINKMYVDPSGNLWVDVLAFPGLTLFNTAVFFAQMGLVLDNNFKLLQPDKNGVLSETTEPSSFTNVKVNDLYFDEMNNMWVATKVGLNQRIKTTQNFITIFRSYTIPTVFGLNCKLISHKIELSFYFWFAIYHYRFPALASAITCSLASRSSSAT